MSGSISARSARWLVLLPLAWLACDDHEGISSVARGTSGAGGYGTSTSATGNGGGATGGPGGASATGSGGAFSSSSGGGLPATRVRVVAANLSTGNYQTYDPGEGIRILKGVHGDVVLMQEMSYGGNTAPQLRALIDEVCGVECAFTRGSGQIPNGVVSRYPILDAGTWTDAKVSNRDFVWARLDVPGPRDLWVVSVHLLTSNPVARNAEAAKIIAQLDAKVPPGSLVVVGGDFNTVTPAEPAMVTFGARLSTAPPYPADGNGNTNTNGPRSKPHDWVLPSLELRARETPVVIGAAHFDTGLVVDTRVYTPIADLAPALVGDSGAPSMQHMAVVRDFLLQ